MLFLDWPPANAMLPLVITSNGPSTSQMCHSVRDATASSANAFHQTTKLLKIVKAGKATVVNTRILVL